MAEKKVEKTTKENTKTPTDKFAVIATGGKQYVVRKGNLLKVEKMPGDSKRKAGDKITFDQVLLVDDGKNTDSSTKMGTPTISTAKVEAKLVADDRDKKLHVIRFRAKSRHFRKLGHRQPYTLVEITKI